MSNKSMPIILAIDTSADVCSVALSHAGDIQEKTLIAPREHTQRLLPMAEKLLADSGISLKQIDAIAVNIGPGSFTGLRIGLSTAQGIAYGIDCPVLPVSSLTAMAEKVSRTIQYSSLEKKCVIPAIDARMNEIYWSAYELSSTTSTVQITKEHVTTPREGFEFSQQMSGMDIFAVGSGWRYAKEQELIPNELKINTEFYATAYDIVKLAIPAFDRGEGINASIIQPSYLRNEITWKKRTRIRT